MSASNPLNGRRGRRSGSGARDTRNTARELLAWLEQADDRDDDGDDGYARAGRRYEDERRVRRNSSRSLDAILDRLEDAAQQEDDQQQDQLAAILEKFEERIEAVEENNERVRLQARKQRAENVIQSRMSTSLDALKDRLETLQDDAYKNDAPKNQNGSEASEAQAALRAQLAKLEQRFSGLSRARAEANKSDAPKAADVQDAMPSNYNSPHRYNPAPQSLAQIEQRIEYLSDALNSGHTHHTPMHHQHPQQHMPQPVRPRIQPPPAVNANHYPAQPAQWAHEPAGYADFQHAPVQHHAPAHQASYTPAPQPVQHRPYPQQRPAVQQHVDNSALHGMEHTLVEMERRLRSMDPHNAVSGLRHEMQGVRERLDTLAGHEPNMRSLEDVRTGTMEIRNALHGVHKRLDMLAGNEPDMRGLEDVRAGTMEIRSALQGLHERLDMLTGHEPDMRGLEDVRAGTMEIRNAVGRLPSTEAFAKLARDVQIIAGKLDQFTQESSRNSNQAPALAPLLNNAVHGIHNTLEQFGQHFDKRLENISQKQQGALEQTVGSLDASVKHFDSNLNAFSSKLEERIGMIADNNTTPLRLNGIEHNLSSLFRKLEEQRAEAQAINRQRDEEASLVLDRHMQELGKQLDYTRRNVAEITAASAEHLIRATATSLDDKTDALKQHTSSALDSMTDRLASLTEKAVANTSGKAVESLERNAQATTSALEKIAANTTRQISTLEIAVREIGSRLDRIKTDNPAPAAIDHLRMDVQELSKHMGRMPFSALTQPNMMHMQHSISELLGRVESLNSSRSYDNASEILRNAVSDIAAQVVQSVREQLSDTSITVRAQLNDTSFHALQRSLDNLGERIEQRSDAHNSRLLDAVQKSINSLGVRLDQVSRSAPEPVAINTIQAAIENLAAKLEKADTAGQFNAGATINKAVNELAERLSQTNVQLGSIASLENGLTTLLSEMNANRHTTIQASEAIAAKVVRDVLANQPQAPAPLPAQTGRVNELAQTMAELKADAARSEQRTNDQLNAVRALVEKFATQPTMPFAAPAVAQAPAPQPEQTEQHGASSAELARAAARRAMAEAREAGHVAPVAHVTTPTATEKHAPAALLPQAAPTPAVHTDNTHLASFKKLENPSSFQPNFNDSDEEPEDILDLVNEHVNTRSRFIAAARRSLTTGHPMDNASLAAVEAALDPANTNEERNFAQDAFQRAKDFAGQGFATPVRRKSMMVGLAASLLLLGSYQVAQHAMDGSMVDSHETAVAPQSSEQADELASIPNKAVRMVETAPVMPQDDNLATSSVNKADTAQTPAPAQPSDNIATGSVPNIEPMAIPEPLPPAIGSPRLRTRAFAGDPAAQYEVAVRYTEGRGVGRNLKAAAAWYDRAARQGLAPAQYRVASLYEKGSGIDKNIQQAKFWYEKAALAGNARAMHNLGVLYAEGGLGKPDFQQASSWFRQGADHGIKDSQFNYAILLVRGLGVKQDLAESYVWLSLVADQGDRDAASKRDQLAAKLDPATLAQVQDRVKNWQAATLNVEANEVAAPPGGWDEALASSPNKNAPVRR